MNAKNEKLKKIWNKKIDPKNLVLLKKEKVKEDEMNTGIE